MVGVYKNRNKLPFISLENFVDENLLNLSMQELAEYKEKQDMNGVEIFVGYNGPDWNGNDEFQNRQRTALPHTWNYIKSFSKEVVPFNIRYSAKDVNSVLLHRDAQPSVQHSRSWEAFSFGYKKELTNSFHNLLLNKDDFKITPILEDTNTIYNLIDFDYETYLKNEENENYLKFIKTTYKLHMIMSNTKTLFIYDNVNDVIYDFDCRIAIFNARDFHDTRLDSWGISIQFPMNPYFLKDEILEYLEVN